MVIKVCIFCVLFIASVLTQDTNQKGNDTLHITKKFDAFSGAQPSFSQCGGLIVNLEFRIASPGFPTCPPAGANCLFTIQASEPQICELELELVTLDLDCRAGDAIIIDGGPPFCWSTQKTKRVRFKQSRINLLFRGAPFSKGSGFVIVGRQLPCHQILPSECGGIYTGSQFEITSPGYPNLYPGNSHCQYVIHSLPGQLVCSLELNFLDFTLPSSSSCNGDHLDLNDYEKICGRIIGSKILGQFRGEAILRLFGNIQNGGRFRIQIRQTPCDNSNNYLPGYPCNSPNENPPLLTNTPTPPLIPFSPYNKLSPGQTYYQNPFPIYLPNCCAEAYNEQYFLLLSQGFPHIYNEPSDCVYRIIRANPNICKLRIRFQYFFLGEDPDPNHGCLNSYLELEGQRFCGCQSGRIWTSKFDINFWGEQSKILIFHKPWGRSPVIRGFVLEVQQLECFRGRSSLDLDISQQNETIYCSEGKKLIGSVCVEREGINSNITFEDNNNFNWERNINISLDSEFEELVTNSSEINDTINNISDLENYTLLNKSIVNEIQERIGVLSNLGGVCRVLNFGQWLHVLKKLVWARAWCPLRRQPYQDYQDISQSSGVFTSPGYPRGNTQPVYRSYRFNLMPEHCSVRVVFDDFCLDYAPECVEEALIDTSSGRQFCGNALAGREVTLPGGGELIFRSSRSTLRGFSARYDQILCPGVAPGYPENMPSIPAPLPGRPPPVEPPFHCRQDINVERFSLNINEGCNYHITPSHPGICRLRLTLQAFDLPCSQGELRVSGRKYCGRLTGHTLCFDFLPQGLDLNINKNKYTPILHIFAEQLDCYQLTVPVQRSLNLTLYNNNTYIN